MSLEGPSPPAALPFSRGSRPDAVGSKGSLFLKGQMTFSSLGLQGKGFCRPIRPVLSVLREGLGWEVKVMTVLVLVLVDEGLGRMRQKGGFYATFFKTILIYFLKKIQNKLITFQVTT